MFCYFTVRTRTILISNDLHEKEILITHQKTCIVELDMTWTLLPNSKPGDKNKQNILCQI